jgi:hypothetical protein
MAVGGRPCFKMPAKGRGRLQLAGEGIAYLLSSKASSPFRGLSLEYWAYVPYVTDEDYIIIGSLLANNPNPFSKWQIRKIIKYAKEVLR